MLPPGEGAEADLDKLLPDMPAKGLVLPADWRMTREGRIYRLEERAGGGMATIIACPHPVARKECCAGHR